MTNSDYFATVLGQAPAIELLTQAVLQQRIAPAYLFAGAAGIGKRLTACCWLEMLLTANQPVATHDLTRQKIRQGNHPDVLWVEPTYSHQGQLLSATEALAAGVKKKAPPQIRIEQIRQITKFLAQPPLVGERTVVVIDPVETMAEGAANALLKTLEEPGKSTIILLTHDSSALMPTIVSRCQRIPFQRLPQSVVIEILRCQGYGDLVAESWGLGITPGSPGQSIAFWEQLQVIPSELKTELATLPATLPQALRLARNIDRELDNAAQLALLDYLQYIYWQKYQQPQILQALTTSRQQLLAYVQPRLVWECLFLGIRIAK